MHLATADIKGREKVHQVMTRLVSLNIRLSNWKEKKKDAPAGYRLVGTTFFNLVEHVRQLFLDPSNRFQQTQNKSKTDKGEMINMTQTWNKAMLMPCWSFQIYWLLIAELKNSPVFTIIYLSAKVKMLFHYFHFFDQECSVHAQNRRLLSLDFSTCFSYF